MTAVARAGRVGVDRAGGIDRQRLRVGERDRCMRAAADIDVAAARGAEGVYCRAGERDIVGGDVDLDRLAPS